MQYLPKNNDFLENMNEYIKFIKMKILETVKDEKDEDTSIPNEFLQEEIFLNQPSSDSTQKISLESTNTNEETKDDDTNLDEIMDEFYYDQDKNEDLASNDGDSSTEENEIENINANANANANANDNANANANANDNDNDNGNDNANNNGNDNANDNTNDNDNANDEIYNEKIVMSNDKKDVQLVKVHQVSDNGNVMLIINDVFYSLNRKSTPQNLIYLN